MSVEAKHSYRFVYLKSEKWANVRVEALAREGGKCQICGEESISNDAHHVWYPQSIWETNQEHLAILCRPCHEFLHSMTPDCKTNDKVLGRETWLKFRDAIIAWKIAKGSFSVSVATGPRELRMELARVRIELEKYQTKCASCVNSVIDRLDFQI